jgi:hypothetical protein
MWSSSSAAAAVHTGGNICVNGIEYSTHSQLQPDVLMDEDDFSKLQA